MVRKHRPDQILMDIQLPRISGFELTQQLKGDEDLRSIPIIALTAFAMRGDEDRIRGAGCDAYLAKPVTVASFLKAVAHFLEPVAA
jgi:two-component system, cell cycle response regulator DivK